jgi:hypothetical protein
MEPSASVKSAAATTVATSAATAPMCRHGAGGRKSEGHGRDAAGQKTLAQHMHSPLQLARRRAARIKEMSARLLAAIT